ncbi:MAG: nucleotidyltransferase [Sphaerobacteraceae bacterium]|nr:MAG: nucleotidyltransferase [Sphaerobacteraceae bacterium]
MPAIRPDFHETVIRLRRHLPGLRERYGVTELGVFGSLLHKPASEVNDIDILVSFDDRPVSLFDFVRLKSELADILGTEVDLVEKKALKPGIGDRIIQEVRYL